MEQNDLKILCPVCAAPPGQPCFTGSGKRAKTTHLSRKLFSEKDADGLPVTKDVEEQPVTKVESPVINRDLNPLADVVELKECWLNDANNLLKTGEWELLGVVQYRTYAVPRVRPGQKENEIHQTGFIREGASYIMARRAWMPEAVIRMRALADGAAEQ